MGLYLPDELNAESSNAFLREFNTKLDDSKEGDIITIYINSLGGDVYSALGIIDMMHVAEKCGYIIQTINVGLAASMAALILMAGTKGYRKGTTNSTIFVHPISYDTKEELPRIRVEYNELERLQKVIHDLTAAYSDEKVKELINKSGYLDSQEALQYNVIDKII